MSSTRYVPGGVNRYICSILEEARTCHKTRNYSYLPGLLEEIQTAANRMEAALYAKANYEELQGLIKDARAELKALYAKIDKEKPSE